MPRCRLRRTFLTTLASKDDETIFPGPDGVERMPTIDLAFTLTGTTIPLDHGYGLFSALCRIVPSLHGDSHVGVHPIRGVRTTPGVLSLMPGSRLRLRLRSEELAPYIALAGTTLEIEGHRVRVGVPRVESLVSAPNLASRLVIIRGLIEQPEFDAGVRRHLTELGVVGEVEFVPSRKNLAGWANPSVGSSGFKTSASSAMPCASAG